MLQISFTDEQVQELDYWRFHYPDPRVQRKLEVVWLKSQGLVHQEIARLAGVSARTVQRHLNEYTEGGIDRLTQNNYAGSPSELNQHAQTLKEYFEKHPPSTIKEAQHQIEQLTGIRRSETQVCEFLKRLGLRRRKLGGVPGKVDEEKQKEQREFLEDKLEPALEEAEQGERRVFLWTPAISCTALFCAMFGVSFVCS